MKIISLQWKWFQLYVRGLKLPNNEKNSGSLIHLKKSVAEIYVLIFFKALRTAVSCLVSLNQSTQHLPQRIQKVEILDILVYTRSNWKKFTILYSSRAWCLIRLLMLFARIMVAQIRFSPSFWRFYKVLQPGAKTKI